MSFEIDISCSPESRSTDVTALRRAIELTLQIEQVAAVVLSVSIVDNKAIQQINRVHLQHDYPTDVISFQLDFARDDDAPDDAPAELRAVGAIISVTV